jgi:hypothetical protein
VQLVILLLLVVALGFLILGLVASSVPLVIASIVASLLAGTAVIRHRKAAAALAEPAAGPAAPAEPAEPAAPAEQAAPAVPARSTSRAALVEPAEADVTPAVAAVADDALLDPPVALTEAPLRAHGGDTVWVVDGRPRYHVSGCDFLIGKRAEPVPLRQASEDGFTPCARCDPDTALAAVPPAGETELPNQL